jgi:hypothetical protein
MTTNIRITTNGSYVSQGTLKRSTNGQAAPDETFSVGPGSMKEHNIGVPHGSTVNLEIIEREATPEEIEAAKPKPDAA